MILFILWGYTLLYLAVHHYGCYTCLPESVMIAQWKNKMYLTVVRVQFPALAEYFKGFFPDWLHSANPFWVRATENGSISPQLHHSTCWHRRGRPKSNHGQTITERNTLLFDTGILRWHLKDRRSRTSGQPLVVRRNTPAVNASKRRPLITQSDYSSAAMLPGHSLWMRSQNSIRWRPSYRSVL